ncbi:MAG: hypothetical protein H7Y00_02715 [Fimbriimonadaceae bacterium]|nr:hypothetical protein [Chitinophagales bacterium]
MNTKYFSGIILLLSATFIITLNSCQKKADAKTSVEDNTRVSGEMHPPYTPSAEWNNYWYQGLAELTSYTLQQSRYGEIHKGTVVNVFVTEDFSKSKQVKLDNYNAGDDKLPVMKINQSIKFNTGIYPYSMMMSSFSPTDLNNYPHAVKTTNSVQEWCGMIYYQLNNRNNKYDIEQRSYFESEGDKDIKLEVVLTEDEIWNLIRLAPDKLPSGEQIILPGSLYLRLAHKPIEPVKAKLSLRDAEGMKIYQIEYPSLKRTLSITFEPIFPYKITGWEDTYPGLDGKMLTTVASKNKEMMLDYWSKHTNNDLPLREQLGLPKEFQ